MHLLSSNAELEAKANQSTTLADELQQTQQDLELLLEVNEKLENALWKAETHFGHLFEEFAAAAVPSRNTSSSTHAAEEAEGQVVG
jgi:translation initiation factor 2 alpha subunit (eIF-2alpha)